MSQAEQFDTLILGSGQGGKLLAWHLARSGQTYARLKFAAGPPTVNLSSYR